MKPILILCLALPTWAQTVKGTAFDPDGSVVSAARVVLLKDFNKVIETATDDKGEFKLTAEPGVYQLQIKKERFSLLQQLVQLKPGEESRVWLVLPPGHISEDLTISTSGQPIAPLPQPTRAGGVITPPKKLSDRPPAYPKEAAEKGLAGEVVLLATVARDGSMKDLTVLASPGEPLTKAAYESLAGRRYQPMQLNGKPIETQVTAVYRFALRPAQ
jgi:TonB family protein